MQRHPPIAADAFPDIPLHTHEMIADRHDREVAAERRRRSWRRRPSIRTTVFRQARRSAPVIS